ncbi:hypothetical protein [Frateuria aurantia]|uniref:hypothetical protein n=1 Tax=Frateuria aurantia TaxID=81475 RepID=UPI0012EAC5E1|nr:hypothetical protein [Frateuria aurantia]
MRSFGDHFLLRKASFDGSMIRGRIDVYQRPQVCAGGDRAAFEKNTATPETALKALQELGVVTAKGKIDKKYAQEPVLKKLGSK